MVPKSEPAGHSPRGAIRHPLGDGRSRFGTGRLAAAAAMAAAGPGPGGTGA